LEILNEDPFELRLATDAVGQQEFEPHSNVLPDTDGEVLDKEVVIIHPSGSAGEPKIFQPYNRVRLPGVLDDVGGRAVDLLLLRVRRLGQVAQEHRCGGDVLPSPRKLWWAIGICDDVLLDLTNNS
jgi:hypothetical protein